MVILASPVTAGNGCPTHNLNRLLLKIIFTLHLHYCKFYHNILNVGTYLIAFGRIF